MARESIAINVHEVAPFASHTIVEWVDDESTIPAADFTVHGPRPREGNIRLTTGWGFGGLDPKANPCRGAAVFGWQLADA
jgi:hypothetical protein